MSRKDPGSPPEVTKKTAGYITQVRTYRLITPLFGGGVSTGEHDPVTIIRGSSIRGQLRFWWRACRGGQFNGNLAEMKAREDLIWGAPASKDGKQGPSQVQIHVQTLQNGTKDNPFEIKGGRLNPRQGSIVHPYAAFPLQPTEAEVKTWGSKTPLKSVQVGVSFDLTIIYPKLLPDGTSLIDDIEGALWAWEIFGGIGARTRRGFGSLQCTHINTKPVPVPSEQVDAWLLKQWCRYVHHGSWTGDTATIPHLPYIAPGASLPNTVRLKKPEQKDDSPSIVWLSLIEKLKRFRQQRRNKHTGHIDPYGHSDWSEPNAIRTKAGKSQRGPHATRSIDAAPRGAFGLPIVFHMPHDPGLNMTLQINSDNDRFASPLILKPLVWNDRAIGLAVILQGSMVPRELRLKADTRVHPIQRTVTTSEARQIPPLNGNPNVLQAFLNFL
ncbi:MAG: type III-B CRISPR module RAMP protein Cmr1 [Chloroflexaceae bacterium]|nr:type III-B CRISPR module RAMP protein Cmr1 [Chloroflexaceae bacterium]